MNGRLDGSAVLITGAASGLGRALVKGFTAEGANVLAFDRSADRLEQLAAEIPGIAICAGDVRSIADNERAVALAVDTFGKLDTFIGNAGIWDMNRGIAASSAEDLDRGFDELFAVNVKGYLLGVKAALDPLTRSGGSVILTLSNSALYPGGGGPLYMASKYAARGLVQELAFELYPDVRVNAVAPGGIDTDLRGPASMGLAETAIGDVIKAPLPKPEDYVGSYLLLAAAGESSTVTGTVLDASGHGARGRLSYSERQAAARAASQTSMEEKAS